MRRIQHGLREKGNQMNLETTLYSLEALSNNVQIHNYPISDDQSRADKVGFT
jgi:hypothetical protein